MCKRGSVALLTVVAVILHVCPMNKFQICWCMGHCPLYSSITKFPVLLLWCGSGISRITIQASRATTAGPSNRTKRGYPQANPFWWWWWPPSEGKSRPMSPRVRWARRWYWLGKGPERPGQFVCLVADLIDQEGSPSTRTTSFSRPAVASTRRTPLQK